MRDSHVSGAISESQVISQLMTFEAKYRRTRHPMP